MSRRIATAPAALAAAVLGASLAGCAAIDVPTPGAPAPPSAQEAPVLDREPIWDDAFAMVVVEVVDGDTLRLRLEETNEVVTTSSPVSVRLIGIDAPEVHPDVECYGPEAEAAMGVLAGTGATVFVAPDEESWDQFDRRLFYVWTPDGLLVNEELARGGYAHVRSYPPNTTLQERLQNAEAEARNAGRGLWGAC